MFWKNLRLLFKIFVLSTKICPLLGDSKPKRTLARVVLPLPLFPQIPIKVFFFIWRFKFLKTVLFLYLKFMFLSIIFFSNLILDFSLFLKVLKVKSFITSLSALLEKLILWREFIILFIEGKIL